MENKEPESVPCPRMVYINLRYKASEDQHIHTTNNPKSQNINRLPQKVIKFPPTMEHDKHWNQHNMIMLAVNTFDRGEKAKWLFLIHHLP